MTRLRNISTVILLLFCGVAGVAQNVTNKGTEFWVAYGHHQYMEPSCNGATPGDNSQNMVLYISNGETQTARVKITIDSSSTIPNPLNWWSRTYDIPPNTVISIEGATAIASTGGAGTAPTAIPKGGAGSYDARLITDPPPAGTGGEGIFRKKGIHIEAIANGSGNIVPVVAYAHIYGGVSSGATMLLPTNAWGYSYTSINSYQADADRSYNWIYVIARQDSTYVEITPSQPSRLGKPKNVPFTVMLMKGQIYQLIGQSDCPTGNGVQLTGTKVRSISINTTGCKPIAVFAGSSRTGGEIPTCGISGRDNDMQQCFPESAWGKRYLTAPASKSSGAGNLQPSNFQNHVYKVVVKDPTTIVKRNGVQIPLSNFIANESKYYQFSSNTSDYIEADKPIMLGMFFSNGSNCNTGDGDPEMIYLSPLEQAIKKVVLLRNNKQAINSNWVTLIVPTGGLPSLRIDGSTVANGVNNVYVGAHNNKPGYSVVAKGWLSAPNTQVTILCDSAFTAYTYGLGGAESYGYNAGTNINNLNALSHIRNTPDTNSTVTQHNYTYVGTPVVISAMIAYKPTKITWVRSALGCSVIQPCTDTVVNNPTIVDSVLVGSAWYYRYTIGTHVFLKDGTYYLPIILEAPVEGAAAGCSNTETLYLEIIVKPKPYPQVSGGVTGCGPIAACFNGSATTGNGYNIQSWAWQFDGGATGTSNTQSPCVNFDTGYHTVKLSIIVAQGGIADTTFSVYVAPKPIAKFGINPNPACPGPVTFIDSTVHGGIPGPVTNWYWDLAVVAPYNATNANNQTATYPVGTYTIRHVVKVNNNCISDTVTKTLTVTAGAMVDFTYPQACVPPSGLAQFTSNSSNAPGVTYSWNFGDPGSGSNTSTAQNPTHTYAANGTYNVSLHINTPTCSGDTTFAVVIKKRAPLSFTAPFAPVCRNAAPVSVASASHDTTTGTGTYFDATGATTSAGMFNPAIAGIGTHAIGYAFTTSQGCSDTIYQNIVVNAGAAKPAVTTPVNYCQGSTAAPLSATADPGNTLKWYDNAALTGGTTATPTPSTATAGTFYYYVTQVPSTGCESDTSVITIVITPSISNNSIGADQTICSTASANVLNATATIGGGTGSYTYQWQQSTDNSNWSNISGATAATYDPGTLAATTYFRRVVQSGLCSNTSNTVTVTVVPAITNFNISANQTICAGSVPALIDGQTPAGAGPFVYGWESSPDNTNWTAISGATGEDYQPGALTATTYYRRVVGNGPCAATSNVVTITVNELANGSISAPTEICQYNSADITFAASAGTAPFGISYTVTNPSGTSNTYTPTGLSNNAVIPVIATGSAAGTYTIVLNSITNSNSCVRSTGLNTITIIVKPTPVVTITPVAAICEGTTATLTANGATTYAWSSSSPNANLNGTTGSSVTASPISTSTYDVVGTTNGCNSNTVSITVTVNPKPAKPVVSTPVTYCQNGTAVPVSATATAGHTLTYYNNPALTGGSATAPTPSTATAGTFYYYVTQTNSGNCTGDTSIITVTVQPSITNNTISADQTLCSGSPAAIINGTTPAGGSGTYTYQWEQSTNGGSTWTVIPGTGTANYDPGTLATTTQFRRTVTSGLCSNTSNVITVTIVPVITNYNISANQTICEGNTPVLIDGQTPGGGAGAFIYTWESSPDNSNWTAIAGATGEDYQPGALTATIYYRRKVVNGPCSATSNVVTITVNPLANGSISGPAAICQYDSAGVKFTATVGTAPFTVLLTITDPSGNTSTKTQSVSSGDTIRVIPVNSAPGNYTITFTSLTNSNGCVRTTGLNAVTITVKATPPVTINPAGQICDGKSATLTANGATTYVWTGTALSSTTGSSVTANPPAGSYNYSVTGTTNGCSATANTTLIVNPTPVKPSVVTPVSYCQLGTAAPLEATGGNAMTVKWYDNPGLTGGVTTAPTPSTTNAGTFYYYVTQTNSFGCESDTAITTVTVNPGIGGNSISADETLCQGGTPAAITNTGTLTGGNGSYTYQWQQSTDGGTNWTDITGATSANYSPGVLNVTTKYRRLVTSSLCGSISNIITKTVFVGLSNYDISASQTICEGTAPALLDGQATTGTGPFTYTWQQSADGVNWTDIPSSNTEDYQPPVLTTTTYYRRKVTNGPCTGFSSPVQITVNPLANGNISAATAICEYESAAVTFNATAGTAPFGVVLTITNPAGTTSTINQSVSSGGTINVIPLNSAPGNYTVALTSLTNSNGCARTTGLNSITIIVKPTPAITINPVQPICEGDSAVLTANGATTYTWAGSNLGSTTGNSVKAAPTANTAYTVTGTTNGCSAQQTVSVTVHPRPVVNIVIADNEICLDQNGVFSSTSSIASGSIQSYHWDFDNGNTPVVPNANPISQSYTTHRVYITKLYVVSDHGCASLTDTAHLQVDPLPVANFQLPSFVCLPNNVATFQNQSTVANGVPLNYSWNFGDPASGAANTSNAVNGSHVYPDSSTYSITLSVVSSQGCAHQVTKDFSAFYKKPVAKFGVTPDTLCQGIQNLFMDSSFAPGSSIQRRLWLFGDGNSLQDSTNAAKIYTRPGNFKVKLVVQSIQGCVSDTASKNIIVYLQPVIDAGPSFVVPSGTTVTFNASANSNALQFAWTSPTGGALSNAHILRPQYVADQDGKFILTATGQGNCKASDSLSVKVLRPIAIPNAFSPNGDGINDKWNIPNLIDYPGCVVEVYNRYGQPVFRSFGYNKPWDGKYKEKELPVGTYYYIIEPKNGFPTVTGYVVIVK